MKVSKLIEALSSQYNPDDSIVIAWWTQESFPKHMGWSLTSGKQRLSSWMTWIGTVPTML